MPKVIHVSGDFPDVVDPDKTSVIHSLLELTGKDFRHSVISLNRRSPGLGSLLGEANFSAPFEWGEAWIYRAPPHGIAHAAMLRRLGDRLAHTLADAAPALLWGHKLTIEGIAVARAARTLGVPYGITIQGNTDTRILAARPDLARTFARVFHEAAVVFAFAPWALAAVEKRLGARAGASHVLPCPTDLDTLCSPVCPGGGLVTAFHLRHHRNKNLTAMAAALRMVRSAGQQAPFTIIGGGKPKDFAKCNAQLQGIAATELTGAMDREHLRERLNQAVGFVMPSRRETFGLVFIEALLAGAPVIYPAGRAIAGYFDDAPFAIAVDPEDHRALAAALLRLVGEEAKLKAALRDWQLSDHSRQFTRPQIAGKFANGLRAAIRQGDGQLPKAAR